MTEASITHGYTPGLLGRVVAMHGCYYAREHGFGIEFECKVAAEMAEFLTRSHSGRNAIFRAESDGAIIGSVTVDGEDLGDNIAHLRWFIMDDAARGLGVGRKLMSEAMTFIEARGFQECQLWTFRGLDAARRLYEQFGFTLADEWPGAQWGTEVREQKFVKRIAP